MVDWARKHVLGWATSAGLTLTMAQMVAPRFMDWILDALVVCLIWVAAKLARQKT